MSRVFAGVSWRLMAGASALAMLWVAPQPVLAQQAAETVNADVDELVVTARRREERLQDVPQSVSSVAGERLEAAAITSTNTLTQIAPGLNFVAQGTVGQPNIRGVGSTNSANGDEANVSMYVDGVYQPDMFASIFQLANIERVEVLKGPQGTLFGRNSTGGSINIQTRAPSFDPSAEFNLSYARFDEVAASAYLTTGLSDRLAVDLALAYADDEGYVQDIARDVGVADKRTISARSKAIFDVSDDTRVTLGLAYTYDDNIAGLSGQPVNGNTVSRGRGLIYPTQPFDSTFTFTPANKFHNYQGFVRLETDLGWAGFSSQTSLTTTSYSAAADSDYSTAELSASDTRTVTETIQQEFLFTSNADSRIQWVGGLFVYHATSGYQPRVANFTSRTYAIMTTDSIAPFGELTYALTSRLSITGGVRLTWEEKKLEGNVNFGPTRSGSKTWTELTPRVVAQYKIPDRYNFYASYSRGFKSGVYNTASIPAVPTPVDPETINAYEIGVKTLAPGPWRATVAGFYYDYKDIQITAFQPPAASLLQNAARAKIYGAEADVNVRLAPGLTANAFLTYTHSEYSRFPNALVTIPLPQGGNQQLTNVDVSGAPTVRTPEWTAGLGLTYRRELAGGGLEATTNLYYNDGFSWEVSNRHRQAAYTTLAASLSWSPANDRYKVTLWGANLTDERYGVTGNATTFGDIVAYAKPRVVGVRLGFKFP